MKRSKKYIEAAAKVIKDHLYTPLEAVTLAKETSTVKYNASIEVALVLGVDPKKADQAIRSTVNLPHGTGKTARVLVFANGDKADAARAAGADIVGGDELIEEVAKGRLDYDAVVSTPDLMGKVGRLGKVLGPARDFQPLHQRLQVVHRLLFLHRLVVRSILQCRISRSRKPYCMTVRTHFLPAICRTKKTSLTVFCEVLRIPFHAVSIVQYA